MSLNEFSDRFSASNSDKPHQAKTSLFFERRELEAILRLYGRGVALGVWRDYGLVDQKDAISFLIFRRSHEAPVYRIEKRPSLSQRQGAFALFNQNDLILKRGRELPPLLDVVSAKLDHKA
jgi:Protein of unknown function (DUF2794)